MAIAPIFNNNGGNTPVRLGSIKPGVGTSSQQISPYLIPGNTLPARQTLMSQAEKATTLGMPEVKNYLTSLVSDLASRDTTNKGIYDIYSGFGNNLYGMMDDRNSFYGSLNQDVLGKLSTLQKQYQDSYGPQGQMVNRVNQLYGNYGNYLLNKNAADRAYSSGIANKYGLSDNAKRISENDVGLQGLSEALKIFDAETQSLDNINKTFNTLTTDAFGKYKGVQDDYLKTLYDSNFGVQTQLSQGLLNLLSNNEQLKNQMKLQKQYSGGAATRSTPVAQATPQQITPQQQAAVPIRYQAVQNVSSRDPNSVLTIGSDGNQRMISKERYDALKKQGLAK